MGATLKIHHPLQWTNLVTSGHCRVISGHSHGHFLSQDDHWSRPVAKTTSGQSENQILPSDWSKVIARQNSKVFYIHPMYYSSR